MVYEYKILEGTSLANAANLNELGKDGWMLVTIIQEEGKFYYYLMREVRH